MSAIAGWVLIYEHLLEKVWEEKAGADMSSMRSMVAKLRGELGGNARNPAYILTEYRVGYCMPEGEGPELTPVG